MELIVLDVDALLIADGVVKQPTLAEAHDLAGQRRVMVWGLPGQMLLLQENGVEPPWWASGAQRVWDADGLVSGIEQVHKLDPRKVLFVTAPGSPWTELSQRDLTVVVIDPTARASDSSVPSIAHLAQRQW